MVSIFVYVGISCSIFFFILKKKLNSSSFSGYSVVELIAYLLLMRACPFFMLEHTSAMNYIAFASDIIFIMIVSEFSARVCGENRRTAAVLYLFSPLPIISIVSGNPLYILLVFVSFMAILVLVWHVKKKLNCTSLSCFFYEFILYSAGIYLVLADIFCLSMSAADFLSFDKFPVLTVIGIVAIIIALVLTLKKLKTRNWEKVPVNKSGKMSGTEINKSGAGEKFGIKNLVHIVMLTAVYAVVVFFRIGSVDAPQSSMTFSGNSSPKGAENCEIVLDIGEYTNVSKMSFFLGGKPNVKISVSEYSEKEKKWIPFDADRNLEPVFCWDEVPVGRNVRHIGIVFAGSEKCIINELVITDTSGNVLTPVNASAYPELFDEQDKYPEYNTYYYRTMFDEIYHGRTAYEFLHDLPIYENTHPPLGKTIISLGIAAFGMTPFGWRVVPAIFGILMVPLMYLFVWKLSRKSFMAFMGTVLFCTEFMHFTLSRIATIDIIVAFFIMLMFFFMYTFTEKAAADRSLKEQSVYLVLCGISTALAVSTKWTGVYAAMGIAVIFIAFMVKKCVISGGIAKNISYLTRLCEVCLVSFIVIPAVVYCLSYMQFSDVYTDKNCIEHAVSNAALMLDYHSGVKSPHPYESEWYEWLIDRRPLLDAITYTSDSRSSITVSTFGNPLILICGLISFIHNIWLWRCKGCVKSGYLVIAYLSMLMPWFFIHRTVFIYQYFVCILIIILMICVSIGHLKHQKKVGNIMMYSSLVLFLMFFPVISGTEVSREYIRQALEWLPTWVFEL